MYLHTGVAGAVHDKAPGLGCMPSSILHRAEPLLASVLVFEVSVMQFCMYSLEGPFSSVVSGYRCGTKLSLLVVTWSDSCLM